MSEYELTTAIIFYSEAKTWAAARLEWVLKSIYMSDISMTCLCGHYPIKEICVLCNSINSKQVDVGNCCVKKFLGIDSDLLFVGLKKVTVDIDAAFNKAVLYHAKRRGWLNEWEYNFYSDTLLKRKLSGKQIAKRAQINAKVLYRFDAESR